ncbi:hypothetical protein [Streptomyces sp. NPDC089919]|uniref:hypothetical protein n=1 Tax=Streptomyces sp. NPDC089919 TaxID=3155188 RepID=UPI00343E6BD2
MSSFRSILSRADLAGVLAAFTALAVAELVAGLVRPAAGPVTVVGGAVIDRTPATVKDFAIRTLGENDRIVLQLGILATLAVLVIGLGIVALSHRRAGAAGVLLFGIVGSAAALSRPDSTGIGDALPPFARLTTGTLTIAGSPGPSTAASRASRSASTTASGRTPTSPPGHRGRLASVVPPLEDRTRRTHHHRPRHRRQRTGADRTAHLHHPRRSERWHSVFVTVP